MKLNMHILAHELAARYDINTVFHTDESEFMLDGILPYVNERSPRADRVYVASVEQLPNVKNTTKALSFVVIGDGSEFAVRGHANVISITSDVEIYELISVLSEIFIYYNEWYSRMREVSLQHKPIREIGVLAERMLKNPVHMLDGQNRWIFSAINTNNYALPKGYVWQEEYADARVMNRMFHLPYYKDYKSIHGLYAFNRKDFEEFDFPFDALSCNVYDNGDYFASFYADNAGHEFTSWDRSIILIVCHVLEEYVENYRSNSTLKSTPCETVLKKLLNEQKVERSELLCALREIDWTLNDEYICIFAKTKLTQQADILLSSAGDNIASSLSHCIWFMHQDGLVLVVNIEKMIEPYQYVVQFITETLSACGMTAGISEHFRDLYDFSFAFKHAVFAEKESRPNAPSFFSELRLEYMLDKTLVDDTVSALCPDSLNQLAKQDSEKGTNNVAVLKYYLENNMNAAETAREFFVHRNTMIYRLQQIERSLDVDISNARNRLLLLWCIELMQRN